MTRVGPVLLVLGAVLAGAPARGVTVLFPAAQEGLAPGRQWLVIRHPDPVEVRVDGVPLEPVRREQGVSHLLLSEPTRAGARVEIRAPAGESRVLIVGDGTAVAAFHGAPREGCVSCHVLDQGGCTQCHRWEASKHRALLERGCSPCHRQPGWAATEDRATCSNCHPLHAGGKHPRLRHATEADHDPLRPGRRFGCVSCHDPHAPECLSSLDRGALRTWCKGCHGRPQP